MALAREVKSSGDPSLVRSFKGPSDRVNRLRFNENMKQLASVDKAGVALIYDFRGDMRPYKYKFHPATVSPPPQLYDVLFLRKNDRVVTCGEDKTIRVIKNRVDPKGKDIRTMVNNAGIRGIDSNDQEDLLLSYGDDKVLKIWDLQRFKFMASLKGHCNVVRTGVFSQDSRLVVSGGQDKSLRLWDVSQGKQVYCLPAHSDDVTQVRFQDNLIYSASKDHSVKIHDSRSQDLVQMYQCDGSVNSISLSARETRLASGEHNGLVKIWDARLGVMDYTLHAHSGPVSSVEYSPQSEYLATAGHDRQILIWDNHLQKVPEEEKVHTQKSQKRSAEPPREEWKERVGMKIHQATVSLQLLTERMQSLDSRLNSNEESVQDLLENPLVTVPIKSNLQDDQQFQNKSFKSVWEAFQSVKTNACNLHSFHERLKCHPSMQNESLALRDDLSDQPVDNIFQKECLADSSGQIMSDLLQTKTQKQLQTSLLALDPAFNQTFNQ